MQELKVMSLISIEINVKSNMSEEIRINSLTILGES